MKITVKRIYLGKTYTIGKMYLDGEYFCDTLEDPVRDLNKNGKFDNGEKKIFGQTAIPYGEYKVILNRSPKFKRVLPRLLDVPHFEGILIHRGNSPKDTAGCILVGKNKVKGLVLDSTKTEIELIKRLQEVKENIQISIE